jgi:hypothetical protein
VQPDLENLKISKGELKHFTGIDIDDIMQPASLKTPQALVQFLLQELLLGLSLTPIIGGFLYIFILLPFTQGSIFLTLATLITTPLIIIMVRWFWLHYKTPQTLLVLLAEIDQYHTILKAIDISDQMVALGSLNSPISDRKIVIEALQLTRSDLIRALQTERILRDNQKFITTNPELLTNHLTTLQALQITHQGTEYGQFLQQAIQIGIGVQAEMRKLQNQHSREP